jgi:hypothetical protein
MAQERPDLARGVAMIYVGSPRKRLPAQAAFVTLLAEERLKGLFSESVFLQDIAI